MRQLFANLRKVTPSEKDDRKIIADINENLKALSQECLTKDAPRFAMKRTLQKILRNHYPSSAPRNTDLEINKMYKRYNFQNADYSKLAQEMVRVIPDLYRKLSKNI